MSSKLIPFNVPSLNGKELGYIQQAIIKVQISRYLFGVQLIYVDLK